VRFLPRRDGPGGRSASDRRDHSFYNTSYEELGKRELAGPIIAEFTSFLHGDRGNHNGAYLPPKTLGSHASKLIAILTDPSIR
jgi:hypothetical protein